ncbi:MAG TPA: hypothetical protein VG275_06930 [Solirubrobacteraceae bacterium]|jgi:hypothetical protein|nr:hypothetical protein [Solirubrobacteraceae bacterium]
MAQGRKLGLFRRREPQTRSRTFTVSSPGRGQGPWAMVSSAARLDVSDSQEAKVQRMLRQGWQSDAWNYRDAIGELRYAVNFLANCSARMRIFPACYPEGGESDLPVALEEVPGIPEQVISTCAQAIQDLGNGRMAISGMMHGVSTNKSVAGEFYLLGRTDPQTSEERWSVRSVDELVVYDDVWHLREIPDDRQNGIIPWIKLEPELTVISRCWTPHPRFQLLADSPFKAMLDDCESLTILRRMIRATGRSRLASRGLLLVPDELSLKLPLDDDSDPEADPFMAALSQAMMAPMANEGTADGVVPIVIRGPADALEKMRLLEMAQSFDERASKTREEMLGVLATTFDLPKEVILGIVDLNHWSAWQVDDNTFRHHVEPHVIGCCDDLSGAYFRPYLLAAGIEEQWVNRLVLWYDPTELVTHPDRAADAQKLYDAMALSGKSLRAATGFTEEDAPTVQELEMRRVMDIRALPLNLLMEYASRADPSLVVPPMTGPPQLPGIRPGGGVDVGAAPGTTAGPGLPAGPPAPAGDSPPAAPALAPGPPPAERPEPKPPAITAAGSPSSAARLSRRLAAIDSDLRARLQTAANAAMLRALERAGAKLRTKVAKDETLRSRIAHRANERVPAILGPEVVAAAGLSASALVGEDWAGLRSQFHEWTAAAQTQAIATALRIGQLGSESDAAQQASDAMAAGRDAAWELLSESLTSLGHHLLYSPDPNTQAGDWAGLNPDTLVPAGTIRAALGVAGGASSSTALLDQGTGSVALATPVGQIGTGSTISELLTSAGVAREGYEWVHGPSLHPFEGHEDLDGLQFESFDDEALANSGDWPENEYFMPGDHDGCLCDFMPIYLSPGEGG